IIASISQRAALPDSWLWVLLSGVIDLILAAIIISGWPGTAAWVLGLLVGVNLIMSGVALIVTALACRRVAGGPAPAAAPGPARRCGRGPGALVYGREKSLPTLAGQEGPIANKRRRNRSGATRRCGEGCTIGPRARAHARDRGGAGGAHHRRGRPRSFSLAA